MNPVHWSGCRKRRKQDSGIFGEKESLQNEL